MPIVYAPTRKPNLTRQQFAARYKAERALQLQRYCKAFELWRLCPNRRCRREGGCHGEARACLERVLATLSNRTQWQARQKILAATPHNIGAPECAARQCMPIDFFAESPADAAAQYFARFAPKSAVASRR